MHKLHLEHYMVKSKLVMVMCYWWFAEKVLVLVLVLLLERYLLPDELFSRWLVSIMIFFFQLASLAWCHAAPECRAVRLSAHTIHCCLAFGQGEDRMRMRLRCSWCLAQKGWDQWGMKLGKTSRSVRVLLGKEIKWDPSNGKDKTRSQKFIH